MAIWQDFKALYDAQNFAEALQYLLSHPEDNSTYYYSLGTVYARLNQFGTSFAYLEKAKKMNPNDLDIRANSKWVEAKLLHTTGRDNLDAGSLAVEQLGESLIDPRVQVGLSLTLLICLVVWTKTYWSKKNLYQSATSGMGGSSLVGGVSAFVLILVSYWSSSHPAAVCLHKITIRSGPGDHFIALSHADAGLKLRLLSSDTQIEDTTNTSPNHLELWRQVRYSEEGVGWVKSADLLVLK